jgi:hypothetical protein
MVTPGAQASLQIEREVGDNVAPADLERVQHFARTDG